MFVRILQIAVPFVWFGMIAAISFMEAPLKFQAPGVTLPIGLGIGRLVFFALNKAEIVLALALAISFVVRRPPKLVITTIFIIVILILGIETVWLLPLLDARAETVINGTAEPFSRLHLVYIAMDAIKLVLVFLLGVSLTRMHLINRESET